MSEHWSPKNTEIVRRVPSWTKPAETPHFTPWSGTVAPPPEPTEEIEAILDYALIDPVKIHAEGYAEGLQAGRQTVEAEIAAERDAITRLAEALETLQPEPPRALGLLLAETVDRLVRQIVGEVTIDTDTLLQRAHAAAEIIADETAPARMRLHPDDLARMAGARLNLELVADTHLAPGTILIETGDGWIEDGPAVRLEKLRAGLDKIGIAR